MIKAIQTSKDPMPYKSKLSSVFTFLTFMPIIMALALMLSGLIHNKSIVYGVIIIGSIYFYIGSLFWLFLSVYLKFTNKINWQKLGIQILILIFGLVLFYFTYSTDFCSSGANQID